MWGLVLSALGALAPKLIEQLQSLWDKYGEKFLIYRKGAADQHRKDEINQMNHETLQANKAQERVHEIQKEALDKRGTPVDGSDIFGSVQHPGESRDWSEPKS